MENEDIVGGFKDQKDLKSEDLFEMIEKESKLSLTFEEEKSYFNKFLEYSKIFSSKTSELQKVKKESDTKMRTSFE